MLTVASIVMEVVGMGQGIHIQHWRGKNLYPLKSELANTSKVLEMDLGSDSKILLLGNCPKTITRDRYKDFITKMSSVSLMYI